MKQSKRKYCMEWESGTRKSVDLKHTDLEVTADAERGVVERQAAVCFAVANVLVHPYRLALSVNITLHFRHNLFIIHSNDSSDFNFIWFNYFSLS